MVSVNVAVADCVCAWTDIVDAGTIDAITVAGADFGSVLVSSAVFASCVVSGETVVGLLAGSCCSFLCRD